MPWAIGIDGGRVGRCTAILNDLAHVDRDSTRSLSISLFLSLIYLHSLCHYQFLRQIFFAHFCLFVCRGQDVFLLTSLSTNLFVRDAMLMARVVAVVDIALHLQMTRLLGIFSFDCKCCHFACSYLPQICKIVIPEHPYLNSSSCPLKKEDEKGHIYNRTCIDAFIRFWFHDIPCSS